MRKTVDTSRINWRSRIQSGFKKLERGGENHFLLAFGYEVRCGDVSIPGDGYGYQIALRG